MRAGKLDKVIEIETAVAAEPDEYGVVDPAGGTVTTRAARAQIIQASTEEYLRGYGEGGNTAIIFRTRFLHGVTTDDRLGYAGRIYNIREVKEIGRRVGLELRCEEVRS
jgi:SPP1 family predicted phage head-tail adaptor